ncbi:MAG: hypothetical protein EPO37_00965 [Nitrosarchaeum sp.]|nr:MAG: hypothetical protein EPO37_00965 [Nitrosarchaeum sp.]
MKYVILTLLILSSFMPYAQAAQLDAKIPTGEETINPSFQFLRVIYIEYPNGGEIAKLLQGKTQTISFSADSKTTDMDNLINQINQNLRSIPSDAFITDAKINYQAILSGNKNSAVIEYKIELIPTITNHVIQSQSEKSTIDANWRGIKLDQPILIDTEYGSFDINNPKSALDVLLPDVMTKIKDKNIKILELPILDASGILNLPLHKWQSLFDNTAIIPGAVEYKFSGKYVITHYTMGECSVEVGACNDRKWSQDFEIDKKYSIKIVESQDDASIAIEGYADSSTFGGVEVFETSLKNTVSDVPETGFPGGVMYGMAGMAVIGGIVMFVVSNRKLKQDKNQGQTGIDPAHLRSYETSDSARGYKTNRGESYLVPSKSKMPI